jgi:hypothetical protein
MVIAVTAAKTEINKSGGVISRSISIESEALVYYTTRYGKLLPM